MRCLNRRGARLHQLCAPPSACGSGAATVAATALRAAGLDEPAINPRAFVALFDGYGLHRIAGCDDQGLEDAVMALWAAATRAIGTR